MTTSTDPNDTFVQRYFWFLAAAVLAVVVAGFVVGIGAVSKSAQDLRTELNRNYVEEIDVESIAEGGGGSRDLIVIDGVSRYDCSEDDGRLDCSDDPRPTPEE